VREVGKSTKSFVTLSDAYESHASIELELFGPDDQTCSGPAVSSETLSTSPGVSEYESAAFTSTEVGTYHWVATYVGDGNNEPAASSCGDADATFEVTAAEPSIATTASAGVPIGGDVHASATLTGGYEHGGTIEFALYGPNDSTCTKTPAYTHTVAVSAGTATYESGSFTPLLSGAYHWVASYSGDANNEEAESGCGDASAAVSVGQSQPTLTGIASAGVTLGGKVHATATLADGHEAEGVIEFALYGPDDATCSGTPVYTKTVPVTTGMSTYESGDFAPTAVGTYRWVASYSGDVNNAAAATSCGDAAAAVAVAAVPVTPVTPVTPTNPTAPVNPSAPIAPAPTLTVSHSPNTPHQPNPKGGPRWTFVIGTPPAGTKYMCRLDGGPFKSCSGKAVYRNLSKGTHHFQAKAVNTAGQESTIKSVNFIVGKKKQS
jgi:hypothetical protein